MGGYESTDASQFVCNVHPARIGYCGQGPTRFRLVGTQLPESSEMKEKIGCRTEANGRNHERSRNAFISEANAAARGLRVQGGVQLDALPGTRQYFDGTGEGVAPEQQVWHTAQLGGLDGAAPGF